MGAIFRSYFSKNNTLINTNDSNNAKNPVTELIHGGEFGIVTRFIFSVNFDNLLSAIENNQYNKSDISKHILHLTNTIRYAEQYVGKNTHIEDIQRSSGFKLEFFKLDKNWSEGTKYHFNLDLIKTLSPNDEVCNWHYANTNDPWNVAGAYNTVSGNTLGLLEFKNGSEDINLDITDYINSIIDGNELSYGIGIKYESITENSTVTKAQSVGFHSKYTNTYYEPYVETQFSFNIDDNRSNFYLDKDNVLILDLRHIADDVTVENVKIHDFFDNIIQIISNDNVGIISKNLFSIHVNRISSETNPDAVIFLDEWNININGISQQIVNKFYLKSFSEYLYGKDINLNNYHVTVSGIYEEEKIIQGDIKKIIINTRELYKTKKTEHKYEYGVFTKVGNDAEITIIPFNKVNKINNEYSIDLNTIWMIPQDYYLKIKQNSGNNSLIKNIIKFTVMPKY